jgi:hypothetical protein
VYEALRRRFDSRCYQESSKTHLAVAEELKISSSKRVYYSLRSRSLRTSVKSNFVFIQVVQTLCTITKSTTLSVWLLNHPCAIIESTVLSKSDNGLGAWNFWYIYINFSATCLLIQHTGEPATRCRSILISNPCQALVWLSTRSMRAHCLETR